MSDPEIVYFESKWAHYFIFGCAILSIVWGVINVLIIQGIKLDAPGAEEPLVEWFKDDATSDAVNDEETGKKKLTAVEKAQRSIKELIDIGERIEEGAIEFLKAEYLYLTLFCLLFAVVIGITVDATEMKNTLSPSNFPYTATAFLVGAATSILSGYIGMRIAVYTNNRTTYQCCKGTMIENASKPMQEMGEKYLDELVVFYNIKSKAAADAPQPGQGDGSWTSGNVKSLKEGFMCAFQGGQVLGFCLVGLALLILEIILVVFKGAWLDGQIAAVQADAANAGNEAKMVSELIRRHFEFVAGYGLGGSTVALFGRVGGGIYTKAADVGADLVGKVVAGLEEDSPENPGTIADNVGDNVGDIAGMGADLFGSLAESTCAALVVSSTSPELILTPDALYFPLIVTSVGIIASFLSVLCASFYTVTEYSVQTVLKHQLGISTILMTIALWPAVYILPETFTFNGTDLVTTNWQAYGCIMFGLWSGMLIGFVTEYYTSNAYNPTLKLYKTCRQGAATNVIQGLALGYTSCIVPIVCITATIGYAFTFAGMYGIGLAAIGMLGSLPVALTIDGYGPISDNAGGLAEMSGLPSEIRDRTDALDAAGNTTAAIGKGFAIGSACLVGLALFGAFVTRIDAAAAGEEQKVDILKPIAFCGLLIGAMLPYWFSALTMTAVGNAAEQMMFQIMEDMKRVAEDRAKVEGEDAKAAIKPNYMECIKVSTTASLMYMIAPGLLVILTPIVAGVLFGYKAVEGLLAGIIVSGVQVAISASNTGGAWDNAKKEAEKQRQIFYSWAKENWDEFAAEKAKGDSFKDWVRVKMQEFENLPEEEKLENKYALVLTAINDQKNASVIGDTVGDPLKDTSGPAINILIKLSAITSLVFGSYIKEIAIFAKE